MITVPWSYAKHAFEGSQFADVSIGKGMGMVLIGAKSIAHRFVFATITCLMWLHSAVGDDPLITEATDGHDEYLYEIRVSPDGDSVLTASGDNTAVIWDADALTKRHVLQHDAAVYTAAWHPQEPLIVSGTGDGNVLLWNADSGQLAQSLSVHHDAIYCVDYSPDGKMLAVAGGSTDGGDTGIRVFSTADHQVQHVWAGHQRQVYGVAWSPDGRRLASSSSDKTIRIWHAEDGTFQELTGHTSDVYRCVFSDNGKQLVSASQDGTVRVWNLDNFSCTATLSSSDDPVYGILKQGGSLRTVGGDGKLTRWMPVESFKPLDRQLVLRGSLYALAHDRLRSRLLVGGENGRIFIVPNDAAAE